MHEDRLIKDIAEEIIAKQNQVPIPVTISNRHIHITEKARQILFGDKALTVKQFLNQPGEFAAQEVVKILGPKGHFDSVRVVGPTRSKCQVEVSLADCYHLGIKTEIRDSGKIQGTAGLYIAGPVGVIRLEEGVIVAKRHIHMTQSEAAKFGVKDGELVRIRFTSGPRKGILGDVRVRVSDNYTLECHLDIEEANALAIKNNDTVFMEMGGI